MAVAKSVKKMMADFMKNRPMELSQIRGELLKEHAYEEGELRQLKATGFHGFDRAVEHHQKQMEAVARAIAEVQGIMDENERYIRSPYARECE